MNGVALEKVVDFKDLCVSVDPSLSFKDHIYSITPKANQVSGMIKRSIGYNAPSSVKLQLYIYLCRSKLENCSQVWSPQTNGNILTIESVQHSEDMAVTVVEIAALCLAIIVIIIGAVVTCIRCCRSISALNKEQPRTLRHDPERGFHVTYFDSIRQSFRRSSRKTETKNESESKVTIPRVHVATVEDLIAERSDIHPQYLDKSDSARTAKPTDNSPFVSQASYQRFENEHDDEYGVVNILQFKEEKFEGIENAGSALPKDEATRGPPGRGEEEPLPKFPSAHFADQCPKAKGVPGFEKLAHPFEKLSDEEIARFKSEFEDPETASEA
ncbi:hypothetical protein CAPTEDRAFT_223382 [Capitella teleta]|uniref:Uncharacterized protein n=1 Tax=Capitella teleta TaxID=283909 RepID=R7VI48_CAPTE|nr:hypothetical protein CAPTEDRAFT_223382 [Capitella teleta]|eukprot:ELU15385.1 hypothetical protein CAPTEDRAFT_223382 [Capitella teleta]